MTFKPGSLKTKVEIIPGRVQHYQKWSESQIYSNTSTVQCHVSIQRNGLKMKFRALLDGRRMLVVASNQNNSATGSTGTSECSPIHCWIKNRTEPKYRFYGKHDLEEHKAWNPVLKNSTTCIEQLQDMRDWKPWLAVFINHARRSLSLSKCHSCHRSWHTTGPTIPDLLFAQLSTRSELSDFRMKGGPVTWTENFVRRQSTIETEYWVNMLRTSAKYKINKYQQHHHFNTIAAVAHVALIWISCCKAFRVFASTSWSCGPNLLNLAKSSAAQVPPLRAVPDWAAKANRRGQRQRTSSSRRAHQCSELPPPHGIMTCISLINKKEAPMSTVCPCSLLVRSTLSQLLPLPLNFHVFRKLQPWTLMTFYTYNTFVIAMCFTCFLLKSKHTTCFMLEIDAPWNLRVSWLSHVSSKSTLLAAKLSTLEWSEPRSSEGLKSLEKVGE